MAWTFGSIHRWSNEVSVACEYQGAQLREHVARLPVVVSTHQPSVPLAACSRR
jgi:hypothetical protein